MLKPYRGSPPPEHRYNHQIGANIVRLWVDVRMFLGSIYALRPDCVCYFSRRFPTPQPQIVTPPIRMNVIPDHRRAKAIRIIEMAIMRSGVAPKRDSASWPSTFPWRVWAFRKLMRTTSCQSILQTSPNTTRTRGRPIPLFPPLSFILRFKDIYESQYGRLRRW